MSHSNHILDGINKDINLTFPNRETYLELTKNFVSLLPKLQIDEVDNIHVIREDLLKGGSKMRAGEYLFSQIKENTVCYVVPRVGFAGIAIAELANLYKKNVVFFMPASRHISVHQQIALENTSVKIVQFHRIAAMPNLNAIARKWAVAHGAFFIPFGLNHPWVIAGYVRMCEDMLKIPNPGIIWTAISTGVLSRGLQIGLPDTRFYAVAVARNLKAGESGNASVISEPMPFLKPEKDLPPFNSVKTYDAKVWKYVKKHKENNPNQDVWFFNVAGEQSPLGTYKDIDSFCHWKEIKQHIIH